MSSSIRGIVCGVDFSTASIAALDRAISLARAHEALLRVVHAYMLPAVPFVDPAIPTIDEARLARALERELDELVRERGGDASIERRAAFGVPAAAIFLHAHETSADLIVVGTRGASRLPRLLAGSVAERIARTSPANVLVVPETAERPRPIRTILCGVDSSEPSLAAWRAASALAASHGARLQAVHVCEAGPKAALGIPEATIRIEHGSPYAAIVDTARRIDADLVVVGDTGRSGLSELLLGSTAERVMRLSEVPVLIVRTRSGAR